MMYSVWNPQANTYDYYNVAGITVPSTKHIRRQVNKLGFVPEEAARILPTTAKRIGRGAFAKGTIANNFHTALGTVESTGIDFGTVAKVGAIVAGLWFFGVIGPTK